MGFFEKIDKLITVRKKQIYFLLGLVFILNINTLKNGYVLDDVVVMSENSIVQKGIEGIPDLLSKEYFYGIAKRESDLSGGRYRPVALVIFALEFEFFGLNPFVGHLINVLLFALLVALLFKLLNDHLFRKYPMNLAFWTCLLFVVHPIHTEVIANIKSRDELLVMILLMASSFALINYSYTHKKTSLVFGLIYFFIALMTRESAIPFILIVPMVSYYFYDRKILTSLSYMIPLAIVFALYMVIRLSIVGISHGVDKSILNFPFAYATPMQAFATKIFLLFKYVSLLFFPFPLSFDYGYNEIPYLDINSFKFMGSLIVLMVLLIIGIRGIKSRSVLSFSILFFFVTMFLFSNFIIDIGAPLAERLLFQASIGFSFMVSYYMLKLPIKNANGFIWLFFLIVIVFGTKTVARNSEWESNYTLFTTDVEACPNSVRTNLFAGQQCLTLANTEKNSAVRIYYYNKAIFYDERILHIHSHYRFIYEDLGYAYFGLGNYFKAAECWTQAFKLDESNLKLKDKMCMLSDVLYNMGNNKFRRIEIDSAIVYFETAVDLNPQNGDAWYNLGGSYFSINNVKNGIEAWQVAYALSPNHSFKRDQFHSQK